jgi:thiamine-phosphate pyrophosphorylase
MRTLYVSDRAAAGDAGVERVLAALRGLGGVRVQLRERDLDDREALERAAGARETLGPGVPLYVNRRFDVALGAGADGVHLPANGLPLSRVRAHTPRGFRIGVSTHSVGEVENAIAEGADLVVIGPVFDTPSKRAFGPPLGPAALAALPRLADHDAEVFAIGGIDEARLAEVDAYRDRISGIAAVRLFQESADPRAMAERIAAR